MSRRYIASLDVSRYVPQIHELFCFVGYDGEFCQNDADGCEIISCLEGQQCFDYLAPLVGAECACPDGYASGNDSKCVG